MEFLILGPLEVVADGRTLDLGGTKQRALLALLLLNANEIVPIDRLIDELWGERPPEKAPHSVQVYVSELRRRLQPQRTPGASDDVLQTRRPGYLIRVGEGELDLHRFERLLARGRAEAEAGDHRSAAETLRQGLALWRGDPLADFTYEPFAQTAIARLAEIHVTAHEERIAADLALGRHRETVAELEALAAEHPLRERLLGLLMLALYRSGRQAEALETYTAARRALVDGLGIDPSPALQKLERAILNQDPELDLRPAAAPAPVQKVVEGPPPMPGRSILAVALRDRLDLPLSLARRLAAVAPHEVIALRLVDPGAAGMLVQATDEVNELRSELVANGVAARAAAFTSSDASADIARLAAEQEVDLLLLSDDRLIQGGAPHGDLYPILEQVPCDVALLVRADAHRDGPVVVPFGGGEHDWAALELAAWLASATGASLRVLGTTSDEDAGRRDASRLLARASLAVQQLVGVASVPSLVPPGHEGILEAAADGGMLVLGLPDRWHQDGLGETRARVARDAQIAAVLVRRGVRPGGLTPPEGLTRYTWSLSSAARSETRQANR